MNLIFCSEGGEKMKQNARGLIAYLFGWIGGLVVLLGFKDNDDRTKFHACQSIVLSVISFASAIVLSRIPVIKYASGILSLLIFVLTIIGMVKAYKEEDFEIPVISDLTRNIFKSKLS